MHLIQTGQEVLIKEQEEKSDRDQTDRWDKDADH